MPVPLVKAHRILASLLLLFIVTHLMVHLTAIDSADMHIKTLSMMRPLYLNIIVEPILILSVIMQVVIGFILLRQRWKQGGKGFWGWLQILSGTYLGFFIIIHSGAALITRYFYGLDTNFYWAAGTLNIGILPYIFTPYYFFAVFSLFSHLSSAVHFGWPAKSKLISPLIIVIGAFLGISIIMAFNGSLYEIDIPIEYEEYFQTNY